MSSDQQWLQLRKAKGEGLRECRGLWHYCGLQRRWQGMAGVGVARAAMLVVAIMEGIAWLRMQLRQLLRSSVGDMARQWALEGDAGNVISYGGIVATTMMFVEGDVDGTGSRWADVGD
ncbi:hypothetical protein BHM03_00038351 [Ensete ventricosum]|nr:hypothetical protein BHM03_00038351 [Ensete ventricosum]